MRQGFKVTAPGVHALHDDFVLFALHHVVGEHGMEVRDGGSEDYPVGAELVVSHLQQQVKDGYPEGYGLMALVKARVSRAGKPK